MKRNKTFFSAAAALLAVSLTALLVMACPGEPTEKPPENPPATIVPKLDSLPEFAADSNPAETIEAAEGILTEMKNSGIISEVSSNVEAVISGYQGTDFTADFDFTDQPGDGVTVSASWKTTKTASKNFKPFMQLMELMMSGGGFEGMESEDMMGMFEELAATQFTTSDSMQMSSDGKTKGETIEDKISSDGSVTIAKGSVLNGEGGSATKLSITKAGSLMAGAALAMENSFRDHSAAGFTVTAPSGSVKVIVDITYSEKTSVKDFFAGLDPDSDMTAPEPELTCKGSVKVYGKDNRLLITKTVNSMESLEEARAMLGLPPLSVGEDDVLPQVPPVQGF